MILQRSESEQRTRVDSLVRALTLEEPRSRYDVDGEWSTIAFLAEHPDNPYLTRWGWWDKPT